MIDMKRILYYTFLAGMILSLVSCQSEPVLYQFTDGKADVSFRAETAVYSMVPEDGNKIVVDLYRGNTKGSADIAVTITDYTGGVFTPSGDVFHFNDGEAKSSIEFTYPDIQAFGGETYEIELAVYDSYQVSPSGIQYCTVQAQRKLTMKSLGEGVFDSYFFEAAWPQELLKAEEADYYELPDCYVSGTPMAFSIIDGKVNWLTTDTGYAYGSYGNIRLGIVDVDYDGTQIVVSCTYDLPGIPDPFELGVCEEIFTLPENVEL